MTSKWEAPQTWSKGHGRGVEAVCDANAPLRADSKRSSEPLSARAQKRTKKDILRMASRQLQLQAKATMQLP